MTQLKKKSNQLIYRISPMAQQTIKIPIDERSTLPQLRALAGKLGLRQYSHMPKYELIRNLRDHLGIVEQFSYQTFDYKSWSKADLRNRCKELSIKNSSNMSIKKMIKAVDQAELKPIQICPDIHCTHEQSDIEQLGEGRSAVKFRFRNRLHRDQLPAIMTSLIPHLNQATRIVVSFKATITRCGKKSGYCKTFLSPPFLNTKTDEKLYQDV